MEDAETVMAGSSAERAMTPLSAAKLRVSPDIRDDLTLLQYDRVGSLIPVLYLTIAINAFAIALASHGDFPLVYRYLFPVALLLASAYRFFVWYRRRLAPVCLEKAEKHLRSTVVVAVGLCLFGGLWTLGAYYETSEGRRIIAAFFILMASFATATCLSSVPRAAIGSIIAALFPITIAMLASPDLGVRAVGIVFGVVMMLIIQLVTSNFSEMVNGLKLQHEMKRQAETDPLTGVSNRRAFENCVAALIGEDAQACEFSVVLIDLDGFKGANDRYGHPAGDAVLVEVARRLERLCPSAHCIARLGGDEFAVVVPRGGQDRLPVDLATTIRKTLALPYRADDAAILISASAGVAHFPSAGETMVDLLKKADRALYDDKGRARPLARRYERRDLRGASAA